jgi:hypothetical protein
MKTFTTIVFLLINLVLFSQDTITTKVIIFDEDDMSKYDSSNPNYGENAIKFNPLLLINGEIPLYYERAINSSFSAEIALGMTYRDYFGDLLRSLDDENYRENTKTNSHFSYKLAIRYYTGGVALDGFYFSLEYANRKYSQDVKIESSEYNIITNSNITSTNNFTEKQFHNEFKIICGSQEHSYWDNFFVDYYIGVGVDKRTLSSIESKRNDQTGVNLYTLEKLEESKPRFYLGMKLGFEF